MVDLHSDLSDTRQVVGALTLTHKELDVAPVRNLLFAVALLAVWAPASRCQAALDVFFDLTNGNPNLATQFGQVSETRTSLIDPMFGFAFDITLIVSASPPPISVNANGLGVSGNGSSDINATTEMLTFNVSVSPVAPATIATFNEYVSFDATNLFASESDILAYNTGNVFPTLVGGDPNNPQTIAVGGGATLLAVGFSQGNGFRVSGVTVRVSAVPEPSAFAFMGVMAMAVGGWCGRGRLRQLMRSILP